MASPRCVGIMRNRSIRPPSDGGQKRGIRLLDLRARADPHRHIRRRSRRLFGKGTTAGCVAVPERDSRAWRIWMTRPRHWLLQGLLLVPLASSGLAHADGDIGMNDSGNLTPDDIAALGVTSVRS